LPAPPKRTNIVPPQVSIVASNVVPPIRPTGAPPERAVSPTDLVTLPPPGYPRPIASVLEAQIALARLGFSPGSVDGIPGAQTRSALRAFQRREGLPATGALDAATKAKMLMDGPPVTTYLITPEDMARLTPISSSWAGKAQQSRLDYESILELVAEKFCSHPSLVQRLNRDLDWSKLAAGDSVRVPNVAPPAPPARAAYLQIRLSDKTLEAYDSETNLLAHFPCSIAKSVEKRPVGELHVMVVAPNPNYTFNPGVFPESEEARLLNRKLVLPPGPNNPVGTAWLGLDLPGYGIHGTPKPEEVGRTESHGCFRLANWNAECLAKLVVIGTPVVVEP
jgi:lipoprotein-anchoring transpeptidase ErfK/SrfK